MPARLIARGACRIFAFLALAAAALAAPLAQAAAAGEVDAIVVKFRDDAVSASATQLPLDMQQRLADRVQSGFADFGRTRDGAFRIMLNPPLSFIEARNALNRVRMDGTVLYANLSQMAPPTSAGRAMPQEAGETGIPTSQIIVKFRDSAITNAALAGQPLDRSQVDRLSALAGQPLAFVRSMHDGAAVVSLFQRTPLDQVKAMADRIAQQPDVEFAQPNHIKTPQLVPTDPCYATASTAACTGGNYQWDLFEAIGGVNMPPAWDITTGSIIQRVAVIDTGYLPHPDLAGRLFGGYDFIDDAVVANDSDPTLPCYPSGGNPCLGSRDPTAFDVGDWISGADNQGLTFNGWLAGCQTGSSSFHGTHVSGTIGANANNGAGITGINWVSQIIPLRVLGKCGGYDSDIADAIVWASGGAVSGLPANPQPARLMNLSIGGLISGTNPTCAVDEPATQNAINAALANGAVVVVAAGNNNTDARPYSPASCNGVITVAATTQNGGRAYYSNFGVYVEIAAPGGSRTANDIATRPSVLSTLNIGATSPDLSASGWIYQNYAGTSMATPHVAGIASLMLSIGPELTPAQVVSIMQTTARAFPAGTFGDCTSNLGSVTSIVKYCGAGIIDAQAAVASAKNLGGLFRAGSRRDFNGNDNSDITWYNTATGEKLLWLMNGGTVAGGGTLLTDLNFQITKYGDFNGDGATDLIWRNAGTGVTVMWLMNGAAFAGGATLLTSTAWSVLLVGDFNGDGKTDLLWRNSVTGEVVIWLMNGPSIIGSNTLLIDLNSIPSLVADFNGDGKDDILWRNAATGQTVIWLMNGTAFAGGGTIMSDANWTATHVADFNGDGKADIVWRHTSGATALWLMNGASFAGGTGLLSDPTWFVVGADDLNGDGKADILWRNTATGNTAAWLMNGTTLITGAGLLGSPWQITRTGDFNGDHKADILWNNPSTGEKVMWLMNGLSPTAGYTLSNDPNWSVYP